MGTNILTGSIIELLRNKPLVSQMGAMTLTGLVGNVAIPRITGGATAYWLNETGSVPPCDQAFGQIGFQPKRLAGRTGYTKELLNQTDLSIEALTRNDLTTVLSLAKDLAALNGQGGAQPLGIFNTTGIGSVTFGGTANRAKMIKFQQLVASANASRGNLAYMTTPNASAALMNVPVAPNYPTFLWDGNIDTGVVVGRRAETTNQVPSDRMVYGNWNDLVLLDWAGIDVVVNPVQPGHARHRDDHDHALERQRTAARGFLRGEHRQRRAVSGASNHPASSTHPPTHHVLRRNHR